MRKKYQRYATNELEPLAVSAVDKQRALQNVGTAQVLT